MKILYLAKTIEEASERVRIEMLLRGRGYNVEWLERKHETDQVS
jgi:hypothetical protein